MTTPSKHTEATIAEICKRLSDGEPLAQICRDEHMPGDSTVYDWAKDDDALAGRIARARATGFDTIAANTRRVAKGEEGHSSGDVKRDKLIVETDLKLLAKWDPKRYGDKQQVEHSGSVSLEALVMASMAGDA